MNRHTQDTPEPGLRTSLRLALDPAAPGDGPRVRGFREQFAQHAHLLQALAAPDLPDELGQPEFLQGIYAHASGGLERELGPTLKRGMAPVAAPADLSWADREVAEELTAGLNVIRDGLQPSEAPGWLWGRIRADLRADRAQRISSLRRVSRRALMAAGLLVGAVGLYFLATATNPGGNGTPGPLNSVLVEVDRGLAPDSMLGG